jgi:hypothetical protein
LYFPTKNGAQKCPSLAGSIELFPTGFFHTPDINVARVADKKYPAHSGKAPCGSQPLGLIEESVDLSTRP